VDATVDATIIDDAAGGSRVSWGAVLAGTVVMLAVSTILWVLALAIVSMVTRPTAASLRGSGMALWICAIGTTAIGGLFGGMVAGFTPGFERWRFASLHGFVAWGLALLLALGFDLAVMKSSVDAASAAVSGIVSGERAAEHAMAPPGGPAAGSSLPGAQSSLPQGQPPAGAMGYDGRRGYPRGEYRGQPGATLMQPPPPSARGPYGGGSALEALIGTSADASWSWFIAWLAAGILAIAGAKIGARRHGRRYVEGGHHEGGPPYARPLTPAPNV
jgi:hypothetical protein